MWREIKFEKYKHELHSITHRVPNILNMKIIANIIYFYFMKRNFRDSMGNTVEFMFIFSKRHLQLQFNCLFKNLLSRINKLICNYNLVKRLFKYLISLSCNRRLKYKNCKKLCIFETFITF